MALAEIKVFTAELVRSFESLQLQSEEVAWRTSGFVPKPAGGVPVRVTAAR